MEKYKQLFLEAYTAALRGETVAWSEPLLPEEWAALFSMAAAHHVQPMIVSAIYRCEAAESIRPLMSMNKRSAVQLAMLQAAKTEAFLQIYSRLPEPKPLVVKGLICRELYPQPDYRMSSDEDLWLPDEGFEACHEFFLSNHFQWTDPQEDIHTCDEASYRETNGVLYLELHRKLLEDDLFFAANQSFLKAEPITVECHGVKLRTLPPTEHLLFLICHALKHFYHSGFGIRQVSDIALFAQHYADDIDWQRLLRRCRELRADIFAAAVFRIGERCFAMEPTQDYQKCWGKLQVDPTDLLEDLLDSGVFGSSTASRQHSSTITLNAAKGGRRRSLLQTVFPPTSELRRRYPYLIRHPWLLPVAWVQRGVRYGKESLTQNNNDAMESIRIGNARVELLREYGIIKK